MIRRRRFAAATALIALSTVAVISSNRPSSAAPMTWSIVQSPAAGALNGVSCTGPTNCVAVGYVVAADGTRRTRAQTMTGATWTNLTTTNTGARNNVLTGVSCPGPTTCVAVGYADSGTGSVTVIETWNGSTWSPVTSPGPSGTGNRLAGVSCATTTACVAVGSSTNSAGRAQPLVDIFDGTTWTTTPPVSPSNNRDATLNSVTCPTTTSCVAVGSAVSSTGYWQTMIETWNGATWTLSASPSAGASSDTVLTGVSCPTAASCIAVGAVDDDFGYHRMLAESWNGTAWIAATPPDPSSSDNHLGGVSCAKPGKCFAVGWSGNDTFRTTLVESLTGKNWTVSTTPPTSEAESELSSVSCASTTGCVTTGRAATRNAEHPLVVVGSTTPDVTAPTISLTSPTDGSYYVVGQHVIAKYSCADEVGGSGPASCVGTLDPGGAIDTTASGPGAFSVTAADYADNSATTTAHYQVVDPAEATATAPPGGASITTDAGGGPTPTSPIVTTLTSVDAGDLAILQDAVTIASPSGYDILGVQIETAAPTADPAAPTTVTFDVDPALLPSNTSVDDLTLLDNAAAVTDCPGAATLPVGVDACVSNRGDAPSGGGDLRLTALSQSSATWNLAVGVSEPPLLSVGNGSVAEGDAGQAQLNVVVSLSQPSTFPVTVDYSTADRTARAGSDYAAVAGTLDFAAGQTTRLVPVLVDGDTRHEQNETFAVTLSSPSGATLGNPVGSETIVDNDPVAPAAPSVSSIASSHLTQLSWTQPASNGSPITSYGVHVYKNQVLQSSLSHTVTCTQPCFLPRAWTVTGLTNDTTYTFTVAAHNAKGTGPAGKTTLTVMDTANGGLLPGRVTKPHATAGVGRLTLTWTAPAPGTGSLTSYTLTLYKNGVLQSGSVGVDSSVRTHVFTGLTTGASYAATVTPRSRVGPGPDSARSNSVRPT